MSMSMSLSVHMVMHMSMSLSVHMVMHMFMHMLTFPPTPYPLISSPILEGMSLDSPMVSPVRPSSHAISSTVFGITCDRVLLGHGQGQRVIGRYGARIRDKYGVRRKEKRRDDAEAVGP